MEGFIFDGHDAIGGRPRFPAFSNRMEATREEVPAWPSGLGIGAVYCPDCEEWTYDVIDGEVLMTLTRREMFGVTWLFIRALVGTWRCKR